MQKKDFATLIMSTVGGILFALGMCMALVPEWGAMVPGIVIGAIGAAILLARSLFVGRWTESLPLFSMGRQSGLPCLAYLEPLSLASACV